VLKKVGQTSGNKKNAKAIQTHKGKRIGALGAEESEKNQKEGKTTLPSGAESSKKESKRNLPYVQGRTPLGQAVTETWMPETRGGKGREFEKKYRGKKKGKNRAGTKGRRPRTGSAKTLRKKIKFQPLLREIQRQGKKTTAPLGQGAKKMGDLLGRTKQRKHLEMPREQKKSLAVNPNLSAEQGPGPKRKATPDQVTRTN